MAVDGPNMGDYGIFIEMDKHAPGKLYLSIKKNNNWSTGIGELEPDEVREFLESVKAGEFDYLLDNKEED